MIVRKIKPNEHKRVKQFCSLAFEYSMNDSHLSPQEHFDQLQNPESRQDLHWDQRWAAFMDDDQTMISSFLVIPYQVNFDGHTVGMAGVGGVATLPQYRHTGGVRACFEHALPDMYEQGQVFSYLYPFSTIFYRKFGYELGCERTLCKIKLNKAPDFEVNGTYHLLEPGNDLLNDIRQVYDVWQKRYNMMTVDEDLEYRWVANADPFRDVQYTYVYRDQNGVPKAVVTYKPSAEEGDRDLSTPTLDCTRRFYFTDAEGFRALIHFMKRLGADHSHILFNLPTDVELGALIAEWSFCTVKREQFACGMVRVINVEQALKLARMRGSGDLVVEVSDSQIKQNNGRFKVSFSPAQPNLVERTKEAPDVVLTIQDFSRLICGRYDAGAWQWMPDVKINCEPAKAAQVFYRKPLYIDRHF